MSSVVISGDTSGAITLAAPAVAGTSTLTLPSGANGTIAAQGVSTNIVSGTTQATTSGTSISFTGIPSWVKKITVMFNAVNTSSTSGIVVQIGSGSTTTSGYASVSIRVNNSSGSGGGSATNGYFLANNNIAVSGSMVLTTLGSNIWTATHATSAGTTNSCFGGGTLTLGGTLDRVVVASQNGTDTFNAGSINILYE